MDSIVSTTIEGVHVIPQRQIISDAGTILHVTRSDEPSFLVIGECYISELNPGAVRAWKKHTLQTQNMIVPLGSVRVVIYDDRKESNTFNRLMVLELGRNEVYARIRIPPLVWYGFDNRSNGKSLILNCPDRPHDPYEVITRNSDMLNTVFSWKN